MDNKSEPIFKTYHFALFGRSSAGKTSLLAAMAMNHVPSIFNYTCQLVPVSVANPRGQSSEWTKAHALHLGKDVLDKAKRMISKGDVPAPTPPTDQRYPIFIFHFTAPGRRAFRIELEDYSGELIDPNVAADELARKLKSELEVKDGLLVLAEAASPEESSSQSDELVNLGAMFAALNFRNAGKGNYNLPVVLLITKWDRLGRPDYDSPETEYEKLNELLKNKEAPYFQLATSIEGTVGKENFKAFPVSAFGECERSLPEEKTDDGSRQHVVERPKNRTKLQSFELESPFVWLARRREEIDLANYQEKVASLARFCPTIPWKVYRLIGRGRELISRFNKETEDVAAASQALEQARSIAYWRAGLFVFMMVAIWLCSESGYDRIQYWRTTTGMANPKASDSDLDRAETWLAGYVSSAGHRHILSRTFLAKRDAENQLKELRLKRESDMWASIEACATLQCKAKLSEEYIKKYPNGKYAVTARRCIEEYNENEEIAKLEQLVHDQLNSGNFSGAASLIKQGQKSSPLFSRILDYFKTNIAPVLEKELMKEGSGIDNKRYIVGEARDLPSSLVPSDFEMKLKEMERRYIEIPCDKSAYEKVRKMWNEEACQEYLNKSCLGVMKPSVQEYLNYLRRWKDTVKLTLVVSQIAWGNCWNEDDNIVTVMVDGNPVITASQVKSREHSTTSDLGKHTFSSKLSDYVRIAVRIASPKMWPLTGYKLQGLGEANRPIKDFHNYQLECPGEEGSSAKVSFKLEGIPVEPRLPQWSENQ